MKGLKTLSGLVLGASLALTPGCKSRYQCEHSTKNAINGAIECNSDSEEVKKHCEKLRNEAKAKALGACLTNESEIPTTCTAQSDGEFKCEAAKTK